MIDRAARETRQRTVVQRQTVLDDLAAGKITPAGAIALLQS